MFLAKFQLQDEQTNMFTVTMNTTWFLLFCQESRYQFVGIYIVSHYLLIVTTDGGVNYVLRMFLWIHEALYLSTSAILFHLRWLMLCEEYGKHMLCGGRCWRYCYRCNMVLWNLSVKYSNKHTIIISFTWNKFIGSIWRNYVYNYCLQSPV